MTSEKPAIFRTLIEGDADKRSDLEILRPILEKFGFRVTEKTVRGEAAGLFSHQLNILYDIADDVENLYPEYEDRLRAVPLLVKNLWDNKTERTEKSEKGGNKNVFERIIISGQGARRIAQALQKRVEFWNEQKKTAQTIVDGRIKKEKIDIAERYIQNSDSKRHNGRPLKNFEPTSKYHPEIMIHARKPMPRVAMLDDAILFFRRHDEDIFLDEVLDAILDNGGKK